MRSQNFALLKQGCNQAIGNASVAGTFTYGVNARIGDGLQGIADDDATIAIQTHAFGQRRVGPDAYRHHHQLGVDVRAIFKANSTYTAVLISFKFLCLRAH